MRRSRRKVLKAGAALAAVSALPRRAFAQAGPIRIGMSMPQTGTLGAGGQAALVARRRWVDDVTQTVTAGQSSVTAMKGSTEEEQFHKAS